MSGIATYTRKLCKLIEGTRAQLMDTRKTTPNFRLMEKWAVQIGGGKNHRYALYDMVMLKDNHVDMAGGIAIAIAKNYLIILMYVVIFKFIIFNSTWLKVFFMTGSLWDE